MKRSLVVVFFVLMIAGLQTVNAEMSVTVDKVFTQVAPVFMEGHAGNMAWVEGWEVRGNILLGGSKIGEVQGEITLLNPPMAMSERYDQGFARFVNTITGVGKFEIFAQIIAFGAEGSETTGDVMIGWQGSIANGTGSLSGLAGIGVGSGTTNIFSGQANAKEILIYTFEQ